MATSIIGDNKTTSPFQGNDSITVERTGVPQGEWAECYVVANLVTTSTNGIEQTVDQLGWKQPDASGVVRWTFNASPTEGLVQRTIAGGWLLPAGLYPATTKLFSDKTGASIETANFEIVGDATTAITTSIKLRGKKK